MRWILDHLQLVFALVIIVGYVLHGLKKAKEQEQSPGEAEPQGEPDAMERARRIQEEIRRRILERQRGARTGESRPLVASPEPAPPRPAPSRPMISPPPIPARMEPTGSMEEVLERQRRLAEQMEAIRTARAPAPGGPWVSRPPAARAPARAGDALLLDIRRELLGPQALRKAVLLREILGEPIGLKPGLRDLPRR